MLWRILKVFTAILALLAAERTATAASQRNYVTVCRDAGAGGYEAFPDVCRTRDGELLCVFYAGFNHVSLPSYAPGGTLPSYARNAGRICLVRSGDNGKTWSKPSIVIDTPRDDRDPSIVQLPDAQGTLLCNYFSHKPGRRGYGYEFVHSALVRSTDGGRTWSAEQRLFDNWACSSPIRVLKDGRLMLPLYRVSDANESGYGGVSFSNDAGRTWSEPVPIGKNSPMKFAAEPDIVELPGGRLLAALRPARGESSMALSWSTDGGRTWSEPEPTGYPANSIAFLLTGSNILIMGHRIPGTSLHYSLDFGKTWSANVQLAPSGGAYPSFAELPDGSIYMVYYEEGPQSDIRGMRFRISPEGVTIIPPEQW